MTDKQIIIDDIDVSGCEAYKDEHCKDKTSIMFCNTNLCSNFPNCYYKQLKAKEQECKNNKIAYQMELDIYNQECLDLQEELKETLKQLDQLKAENEELKKKVYKYEQAEKYPAAFLWQEGLL